MIRSCNAKVTDLRSTFSGCGSGSKGIISGCSNLAAPIASYEDVLRLQVPWSGISARRTRSGGCGLPVDDAHGMRVCKRLTHLVKVQECLKLGDSGKRVKMNANRRVAQIQAQQQRGRVGNLLVGEVRIFADLAIDCTRQVAQLHVSEADK
jgi:hypothetical protein